MSDEIKSPACRQEGESKDDCVSRKIPEILEENPGMDHDQAVAIAYDMCDKLCSEEGKSKAVRPLSKIIGVPLSKAMKKLDDGTLIVPGYFTSDNVDEVGDIITRDATLQALPKYRQWGNIRYMHQPKPVGKVRRIGAEDGLEWNEVEIRVINPDAVFEVENGLLTALSVGILFRFEDIEVLDSGGWKINNYTLAEISLVDHPANYDAHLKEMDLKMRQLAHEQGLEALKSYMEGEMPECEINAEEPQLTETVTPEVEVDIPVEGETLELSQPEPETIEESIDEIITNELPVTEVVEPQPDLVEDIPVQDPQELPSTGEEFPELSVEEKFNEMLAKVNDAITELGNSMRQLSEQFAKLSLLLETEAKVHEASEQATGEDEAEKQALLGSEHAEEVSAPVERKGYVPETELPEIQEGEGATQPVPNLRNALKRYLENR